MKGRVLVIVAALVFLGSLACVLWPAAPAAVQSAEIEPLAASTGVSRNQSRPFVGIAMQVQNPGRIPDYLKAIDQIADEGADTVSLVIASRQENGRSSQIFIDLRGAPTDEQLSELIAHAKARKLRVVLMPIVLLENPEGHEWRGTIHADHWDQWWDSYREMIGHFAAIAQKTGVDLFSVGSELVSTEIYSDEWTKTIQMVRQRYGGLITYSSNWDHYTSVPFWSQLDLMGMNSYWKLGESRAVSVDEIVSRWHGIQQDLFRFQAKINKPLILLEAGWCDVANAAHEPWDYTRVEIPIDLDLQRKLYSGFFRAWWGVPQMGGFMLWEWTLDGGGPTDRGYTPQGKPAETVMKDWFAKPRWSVKP
jgi:hypothetical protein